MQTKKKASGRNGSHERVSPRISRAQQKVSESGQEVEKNVTDLITSSNRKKKPISTLKKKGAEPIPSTDLRNKYDLVDHDTTNACLANDAVDGASLDFLNGDQKSISTDEKIDSPQMDAVDGLINKESSDAMEVDMNDPSNYNTLICGDQMRGTEDNSGCSSEIDGNGEVSATHLSVKNSKLECVDEHGQDSISSDLCPEDDEFSDFDEFNPYLFIKTLPDLSSVVPTFRPLLLPKQTRSCPPTTLVLDLDETLVHSTLESCEDADFTFPVNFNFEEHTVYVRCRPHLKDFLERVSSLFEIIIFTASQSIYAEQLLNVLDPKRKIFRHRVYRESCVYVDGNYLKDLTILGRDLARVIIVDNSPQAFGFQVDNGIPIESWFDDRSDQELILLLPFLESLVDVDDVRPLIAEKFNLRQKIAAAVHPSLNSNRDLISSLQYSSWVVQY
ncbi:uncharacterized protein LOC129292514 isoform X3 [Prosopis cineraria]|uniref:uncharacterized protein LOC129292514 isoform X3 n=1 Tax=Prosopis cineraria TaxID=364024 RepID=UPI00240EE10A|nr:uncharacterized protein LOC129292514 isoform X3 [Prosopis cineraria]